MSGWALFASVFGVIFVAELPDKTALAALVMATRHRPFAVILGAAAALSIQSVVAVAAGQLIGLLPAHPVHVFAGCLFLLSAVVMWRRKQEGEKEVASSKDGSGLWRSAWVVFCVVFVAEWGDLTQLATAALAARYRSPWVVFAGATLALWSVTVIATVVGHHAGKLLDPHLTQRIAAAVFALLGAALVAGLL